MASVQPVVYASAPATWPAAVQTTVSSAAIQIAAVNQTRRKIIIQNVSANAMRVGPTGVTATTGTRLAANETLIISADGTMGCPIGAIFAIRDAASDATACVTEFTR